MRPVSDYIDYKYYLRRKPWKVPHQFLRHFRFAWQRCRKGYCDGDLWSIDSWFLGIIADMLTEFKNTRHGSPGRLGVNYTDEQGICRNDTCHEEWERILNQMIDLFREANEETCQRVNPMEKEHIRINDEFEERYGIFGENLEPDPSTPGHYRQLHFVSEIPEYADIEKKYFEESRKLEEYRNDCKNRAFKMFSEWFWDLWD